jgi:hypothetical protein
MATRQIPFGSIPPISPFLYDMETPSVMGEADYYGQLDARNVERQRLRRANDFQKEIADLYKDSPEINIDKELPKIASISLKYGDINTANTLNNSMDNNKTRAVREALSIAKVNPQLANQMLQAQGINGVDLTGFEGQGKIVNRKDGIYRVDGAKVTKLQGFETSGGGGSSKNPKISILRNPSTGEEKIVNLNDEAAATAAMQQGFYAVKDLTFSDKMEYDKKKEDKKKLGQQTATNEPPKPKKTVSQELVDMLNYIKGLNAKNETRAKNTDDEIVRVRDRRKDANLR